jgi:hypothetical protein
MAQHASLRIDTGLEIYFCDSQSPWQRGSNENTNGLLRQYFPKGTDLSRHTARELRAVAHALNARPRSAATPNRASKVPRPPTRSNGRSKPPDRLLAVYNRPQMIDVDVFPSDTSWLSEPTTGVHQFGGGSKLRCPPRTARCGAGCAALLTQLCDFEIANCLIKADRTHHDDKQSHERPSQRGTAPDGASGDPNAKSNSFTGMDT